MSTITFMGKSRDALAGFPKEVKRRCGEELRRVQEGFLPKNWRPMPSIGKGVREFRIAHSGAWRVIYIVKRGNSVYVLHAFEKKSQKTAREDIAVARSNLQRV